MAKVKETQPGIIPANEYKEDLEQLVRFYTAKALSEPHLVFKKKYTPNKYPTKFSDPREEKEYQLNEIKRLVEGHDGLSGRGYGWLNYAKIRDPEKGKISPEFRAKQEQFFQKIDEKKKQKNTGLVGFKRRRFGFTSQIAWNVEYNSMTIPYHQTGMVSKSENDSRLLFKHVKFIHQNLPDWLRPTATVSDRRDYMEYAYWVKDPNGNKLKKGLQSWVTSFAPTLTSLEGNAFSELLVDEGGKIDILLDIWATGEDCLRLNTDRVGLPIIMGTVGDIDKDGKGLMELYKNAEAYNLERFPVYGYNGLIVDEFGNDCFSDACRWIIYEREKLKSASQKMRQAFIQKYPLEEKDAFNQVSGGGVGDIQMINDQIVHLMGNPSFKTKGSMLRRGDGKIDFVPDENHGKIIIYERPKPRENGYVATCDPVDNDDVKKTRDASEIAITICAKPFGTEPLKLVAEFAYRPLKLDEYYEQAGMLLTWYNNTKVVLEMNQGGWRARKYLEDHYPKLLALSPVSATSAKGGVEWKIGVKMTAERKEQMRGLIEDYVDNHVKWIPSIKLLEQFKVFGDDHQDDDVGISFGWALIMAQSDKTVVRSKEELSKNIPNLSYQKNGKGFQLMSNGSPVKSSSSRGRSALFKW